jgi:hypothetical protein
MGNAVANTTTDLSQRYKRMTKTLHSTTPVFRSIFIGLMATHIGSCGTAKAPAKPGAVAAADSVLVVESTDIEKVKSDAEAEKAAAIAGGPLGIATGFELHAHKLVVNKCGTCHGAATSPLFASPDFAIAADEAVKSGKVDFINIENSRLLLRLVPDKHCCWTTCEASFAEMKDALTKWKESVKDGAMEKILDDAKKFSTAPQLLGEATNGDNPDITQNPTQLVFEAESATLTGALVSTDDPKGSGGKVIAMAAAGNVATLTFNVTVAGNYLVYGLSSSALAANSTVTARFDNGAAGTPANILWTGVITGANAWQWNQIKTAAGAPLTANLAVGSHTLVLTRAQNGFKVDAIAITQNTALTSATVLPPKVNILKFDLSAAQQSKLAPGVSLEIQVEDFDENSYKFKSPMIKIASGSVKLKGLRILLNGGWNPQNATYVVIDETVAAPGKILLPSAMIVPKEKGSALDQISIQFEVLE